jgi:hypothetical protein
VLAVAGLAGLGLYAALGRSGWLPRRRGRADPEASRPGG